MSRIKVFFIERRRLIFIAAFVLFSARVMQLVLVEPFIGIANNGDFERLSCSIGVGYEYDAWSKENYDHAFWGYVPIDFKRLEQHCDTGWWQIFQLVPTLAVAVSNVPPGGHFDIRYVGFVNAVTYLCVIGFMLLALYLLGGLASYCALFLLLLIAGDAYIVQYFNSFYTESGSVFGLFLLIACWIYSHIEMESDTKRKFVLLPIIFIGCILMVNSKQQDAPLVLPLFIGLYWLLRRMAFGRGRSIVMCLLCGGLVALTMPKNKSDWSNATAFNVTMQDLLKDSRKAAEHISRMTNDSLERCELQSIVGRNAFSCGIDWVKYKNIVTREQELLILFHEPSLIFKMTFMRAQNLFSREDGLGNYTRDSGAKPRAKTTSNSLWSRMVKCCYGKNMFFWLGWLCFASVYAFFRMRSCRYGWWRSAWVGVLLLVTFNALRFVTVIVGDGSHDDIKHFFALNVEFDVIVAVVMADIAVHLLPLVKSVVCGGVAKKGVI